MMRHEAGYIIVDTEGTGLYSAQKRGRLDPRLRRAGSAAHGGVCRSARGCRSLRHAGLDDMFEQTPTVCGMRSLQAAKIKIKKLNGKGGWARLIDAAAHYGIDYPDDVHHDALHDALICREVGWHINQAGLLLPPEVHYAKDYQGAAS